MAKGYRPLPVEDPDKNGGGATVVVACDAQHGANMPHTASVSIKKPSSPKAGSSNPPRRSITWVYFSLKMLSFFGKENNRSFCVKKMKILKGLGHLDIDNRELF